ncbi:MAG: asparagine--tRNA ligase [Candidatus Staskawiczbacteria bacterium RIFCSPLOWO2_01_FULL_33_9]|uniref:Asparagine--tRNA ligase n=1 Tax=Candidatus Staskawiczbacteria bacterium RIFCSPLOWO2_01_FULL_33_9 TaxID=1802211 RepID=A0A1G2I9C3_9BACT|nr:MAG: asparagine--tRNA ligase [Candidatus Staskawiczbacteria bacterium RIFCSPLOWO2_01_FULL_33_9]
MLGPYQANKDRTISYKGNKLFSPIKDISNIKPLTEEFENRLLSLNKDKMWTAIAKINHTINLSSNKYFDKIGAIFTALPLTTRMISSPGAFYGKGLINYTTDTCPIVLKWFDLSEVAFLSESSQIYLELALVQQEINQVYSIYNSFRKEVADSTHLSEFHHIEYEGKISQEENEKIALGLIQEIIFDLLNKNLTDLQQFLSNEKIEELKIFSQNIQSVKKITFKEALNILYKDTNDSRYLNFSMQDFGAWEEIRLTEILNGMVCVREFPLLEVPFYHDKVIGKEPLVANNADFIWPGYREVIGSGHRIESETYLNEKAKIFNLPIEDYMPYLHSRKIDKYSPTSGFGLGWERILHGLLEMPFIWSASQFPRIDSTLKL